MLLLRCSQLKAAMTEPRTKSAVLSDTAKSIVHDLVREQYFGVRQVITSKAMQKGIECEQASIDLLNSVFFESYTKNTERRTNDYITGECDIFTSSMIRDIKTSWSIATFPLFETDCSDYEWQMRGYMWLWDVDTAVVDYCLVDTPENLIGYEQRDLHIVSHIDPAKRVKSFAFERDEAKEQAIICRVEQLREYYDQVLGRVNRG